MNLCFITEKLLYYLLFFLRFLADRFCDVYSSFMRPDLKGKIPSIKNKILLKPVTELVEDIKNKKLKCEDLVKIYVERLLEVNKFTNSLVQLNPNYLEEAKKIDKIIETKDKSELDKYPLLGIPITVKESVKVKGLKCTVGLVARKDVVSEDNSEVIDYLLDAGVVILAITNVPELLFWWDACNKLVGRTNNPYDLSRVPGGSTGGCASLVASGGSILSLASDIGGSTRIPANFCGVFGHKTTSEVISSKNKFPETLNKKILFSFGPMCRYAKDLRLCIYAMAGKESIDKNLPKLFEKTDFSKMKIYYMEQETDPFKTPVSSEIKNAIHDVANHFKTNYGTQVKKIEIDNFKNSLQMWSAVLTKLRTTPFTLAMGNFKKEVNIYLEVFKYIIGQSNHTLPAIVYAIFEKLQPTDPKHIEKYVNMCEELKKEMKDLLKDDGILLYPSHPEVAPKHGITLLKSHNVSYTALFNVLSLPATQCPIDLSKKTGMPIGIQVVTSQYQDHLTLSVAEEIENVFGGWKSPCKIEC